MKQTQMPFSHNVRNNSLDCVGGVLIIYMVIYHIFQWSDLADSRISLFLYSCFYFFMPWFFFKAGIFAHKEEINEVLKKGYKRLIKPFILFSLIGQIVIYVWMWMDGDSNWIHYILSPIKHLLLSGSVSGNPPLWFLLSLLVVRILGNYVIGGSYKLLALALCCTIAYTLNYCGMKQPYYLSNIFSGLAFYLVGFLMKDLQYDKFIFWSSGALFLIFLFSPSYVDMRVNSVIQGNYLYWMISSLAGCILINNLFHRYKLLQKFHLDRIGNDSMNYFVMHWIVLIMVKIVMLKILYIDKQELLFTTMLISCFLILPFCNKIIKSCQCRP